MCSNSRIKRLRKTTTHCCSDLDQPLNQLYMKKNKKPKPKPSSSAPKKPKTRKHKFLSDLRRELISSSKPINKKYTSLGCRDDDEIMININENMEDDDDDDQLIINLFPLHPKSSLFDAEKQDEEEEDHNINMAYNFFDSGNDQSGTTLNGLIWGSDGGSGQCSSEEDSLSPPLTYTYQQEGGGVQDSDQQGGGDQSRSLLVRNALRNRERDDCTEEKWVCYSEVVEKAKEEEVSTSTSISSSSSFCIPPLQPHDDQNQNQNQNQNQMKQAGLLLKLDYEEIMNAWSDKCPFYIGDCSSLSHQIVPDILDQHTTNVLGADAGSMLWTVPEHHDHGSSGKTESVDGQEDGMKTMMEEREARVLRYKEKRQSRLFSKRIRYEVRKVNAEKRPRMKGRFVKRN